MKKGISVIICTYNSASRITETLKHLAEQVVEPDFAWEINLIDNASDDGTAKLARDLWIKMGTDVNLHIYEEPRPGKAFALDTGIINSSYDCIIICDDDNWLHKNYVTNAFRNISTNPNIGILGGRGIAVTEGKIPNWFKEFENGYAVGSQAEKPGNIEPRHYIWGAGMVFRKGLYNKVYQKFPSLLKGPQLNKRFPGEDVEFCFRVIMNGYELHYDDSLVYSHYMPADRLTISYKDKIFKNYEFESYVLDIYARKIKILRAGLMAQIILFCSSILRFIFCKIFSSKKWDIDFEAETIYQLTGLKLRKLNEQVILVSAIQKDLAKK